MRRAAGPLKILLVKPWARLATIRGLQRFQLLEPLELGYLAAAVPRRHRVSVLDLRLSRSPGRSFRRALSTFLPDVVGLSGYSHEASVVKDLARATQRALPSATVVVGGHHATVAPRDYDDEAIDAIVRGEGCAPFRALVAAVEEGRPFAGIPSVVVPGESGGNADEWPRFPDPATLPRPRRDLWSPRSYSAVWVAEHPAPWQPLFPPTSLVRSSYGCRMRCSFCVVPMMCDGRHMVRPVAAVADEIASLATDHVYFVDDENFIDETFAWELADALERRRVEKRYFAWTRPTTVLRSPELLRRWRSIGLDGVFLGFEFTTDAELRAVKKAGTVAANERALDALRAMGIAVHAAFMIRPEYDADRFAALERYLAELPPAQCSVTVCTPSPGTEDYERIAPRIWIDDPHRLHDCMHPLTPTALPLKEFSRRYGRLIALGTRRTPLRAERHPIRPADLGRVMHAELRYSRAFSRIYRDYPRELRG